MGIKIDMEKLIHFFKEYNPEETEEGEALTEGEEYLLYHVLQKWISGGNLAVGEIDYDAFDGEDVLNIIKYDKYDLCHTGLSGFVNAIEAGKPVCDPARRFF